MATFESNELIMGKIRDKEFSLTLEDIYHENLTSEEKFHLLCFSISNLHDLNLMMELISTGVCVNFPHPLPKGVEYSPLHTCVSYDMIEAISPLVDAGADVNIRTLSEFPSTPLHLAINERKALIVQELLAKGADPYCVLQGVVILPDSSILRQFHWDCFEMAQLQRLQDTDSEEIWLILSQYKFLEGEEIKLNCLHWDEEPKAIKWMFEPVAVSFHDDIFVGERRQRYDQFLYIFNIFTRQWTELAFHGQRLMYGFTLAVANDHVHIIGGSWKNRETVIWSQDVFSLDYRFEWHKTLPPLRNARMYATSTYFDDIIVVVGGIGTNSSWLSSVEVLDSSLQFSTWWEVPNLPVPSDLMQATVTDDSVFFGCGSGSDRRIFTTKMIDIRSFLATCKVVDSKLTFDKYLKLPSISPEDFWKQLPPTPLNRSGLIAINNCIVTVGGRDGDGKPHKSVYMYNSCKRSWIEVPKIKRSRFYPAVVASVVDNKQELFVLFGCGAESSVEFCEI